MDVLSAEELTAVTGAHAAGAENVVVSDANGVSTSGPTIYTYVPPPTVSSISPAFGPSTGGTPVTVKGSGFRKGTGETKVEIGGVAASSVDVLSAEEARRPSRPNMLSKARCRWW